jgi:CubicO group peptidase (beta-lactamase class C family)
MVFYPRDLARFGLLYVNGGSSDGQSIIPEDWVRLSTREHIALSRTWGEFTNIGYGYYWWTAVWKSIDVFLAVGFGGQFIIGVPAKNLVIVITSNQNCTNAEADQRHLDILDVVSTRVLSAVH